VTYSKLEYAGRHSNIIHHVIQRATVHLKWLSWVVQFFVRPATMVCPVFGRVCWYICKGPPGYRLRASSRRATIWDSLWGPKWLIGFSTSNKERKKDYYSSWILAWVRKSTHCRNIALRDGERIRTVLELGRSPKQKKDLENLNKLRHCDESRLVSLMNKLEEPLDQTWNSRPGELIFIGGVMSRHE